MNLFLILAFLFFIGSVIGWVIELLFRRFISDANPERKWINPGFCTGPYLPLYGNGLCILYLIAQLEGILFPVESILSKIVIFALMAVCMTLIEYIAGILSLKVAKVRLWDYTNEWGNIQGIICPKFSLIWAILGALYYLLVHPHILGALEWLSQNLAFSFFIGLFFGVFLIDAIHSAQIVAKLKAFAEENNVIVRYEQLKADIRKKHDSAKRQYRFFHPFRSIIPLSDHLKEMLNSFEKIKRKS